jgi:hypothetical protein
VSGGPEALDGFSVEEWIMTSFNAQDDRKVVPGGAALEMPIQDT